MFKVSSIHWFWKAFQTISCFSHGMVPGLLVTTESFNFDPAELTSIIEKQVICFGK